MVLKLGIHMRQLTDQRFIDRHAISRSPPHTALQMIDGAQSIRPPQPPYAQSYALGL